MKLIIDIDEEDFEIMKYNIAMGNPLCPISQEEMVIKIANGTLLENLRAEIEQKYEKYKYLFDEDFMGTKDLEWVLSVINRHKGEQS